MYKPNKYFLIFVLLSFYLPSFAASNPQTDKPQYFIKDSPNTLKTWTGFYAGGSLGAVVHTENVTDINATSFNATIQESTNPKFTGGFQLGYKQQISQKNFTGMYGLEFSANYANVWFHQQYGSPFALYEINASNSFNSVYMLQILGGVIANKTLLFFGAGLSLADLTTEMANISGIPYFESFSSKKFVFGTVLSGGIEYALLKQFSVRFKVDVISPNTYIVVDNLDNSFQIANLLVQGLVGINYKFW